MLAIYQSLKVLPTSIKHDQNFVAGTARTLYALGHNVACPITSTKCFQFERLISWRNVNQMRILQLFVSFFGLFNLWWLLSLVRFVSLRLSVFSRVCTTLGLANVHKVVISDLWVEARRPWSIFSNCICHIDKRQGFLTVLMFVFEETFVISDCV